MALAGTTRLIMACTIIPTLCPTGMAATTTLIPVGIQPALLVMGPMAAIVTIDSQTRKPAATAMLKPPGIMISGPATANPIIHAQIPIPKYRVTIMTTTNV